MKNSEYFIEFTKALKSKNNVTVLDFLIRDPYSARTCLHENPSIRTDYAAWKTNNTFANRLLTEDNTDEDFSIAHNVFREIITKRSFVNGAFTKEAHHHVDFFSQKRKFVQTKNVSEYNLTKLNSDMRHYTPNNQPTVNCVDIFTKNNKLPSVFDLTKIGKPKFNIVLHEDLKPISLQQIAEIEKAFYANESAIIEIQEKEMKPLVKLHKSFIENPENKNVDWSSLNPKFNNKNQAKNELDFGLYNFRLKNLIGY
jgi:hypothetical protein